MDIAVGPTKLHWNYFLALERDMELVSRYVEFCKPNFSVYSVELAHLLFAAASEVDVVAKLICEQVAPTARRGNIDQYKAVLLPELPHLPETEVFVPRYGLSFKPWLAWADAQNPEWWRSYNNVKHERDAYFDQATLKNSLNALGALMIFVFHYYSRKLVTHQILSPRETTRQLVPASNLIRFHDDYYYSNLIVE